MTSAVCTDWLHMTVQLVLVDPDKSWETIEAEAPCPSLAPPGVLV